MVQYKFTFENCGHTYCFIGQWENEHLKISEAEKLKLLRDYWKHSLKPSLDQILQDQLKGEPLE